MNFNELIGQFGAYFSTYIVCVVSGFVPVVNAEVYLASFSAISSNNFNLVFITILGTLGQMTAKSIMYFAGRGALKISIKKYEDNLNKVKDKMEKWKDRTDIFIFISAGAGFPPFYIVSILSGILEISFSRFFIFGTLGRFIRFAIIVMFPQLIKYFVE